MDPIKNAGMADYTMPVAPQVQEESYDYTQLPENYYDAEFSEKSKSASNMSGLMALGAIGVAGLALWGGYALGKKKFKNDAEDVNKLLKEAQEQLDNVKKANDNAYEIADKKFKGIFDSKTKLRNEIKKALKPEEATAKKAENSAEQKVAEKAETKAEEASEK